MQNFRSRPSGRAGGERRGRVRTTVLALCVIGTVASRSAQAQLLVDPLEVTIMTAGANRVVGIVTLTNTSDKAVQATVTRQDWDRTESGDNRFLAAGTSGFSCGPMLTESPASIRVEPHSAGVLRLAVQNAAALRKECWDIFFIEELPQRASLKGNSLEYIFRTGVKVYVAPPGLTRDGAVENMAVEDVPAAASHGSPIPARLPAGGQTSAKRRIVIRFHNTGGMNLLAKGRLEFRGLDNALVAQAPIDEFPTLPGTTRKVSVDVPPGIPPGDYIVLALIDFGGAELVAGQIDYHAK